MASTLFRSEEMCLAQLYLQNDSAYACISELGELGIVQFNDLNADVSAFQRRFVNEVRRCDEMERKLRYLEKEMKRDSIALIEGNEAFDAPAAREMVDMEATFERLENELREVNANEEMLKKNFLELTELKHILKKTQAFLDEAMYLSRQSNIARRLHRSLIPDRVRLVSVGSDDDFEAHEDSGAGHGGQDTDALLGPADDPLRSGQMPGAPGIKLGFVAGVISRERVPGFERLLWRACRGNVFLRHADINDSIEDPMTGDQVHKVVFMIFFQGDQLKTRVKKICEGYRATLYPCPETAQERRDMSIGVMSRIEDLKTVLGQTQDHRHRVLVAAAKSMRMWFTKVRKIKSIYHTLNLFNMDVTSKCLVAECWCPVVELDKIQMALNRSTEESGSTVPNILNRIETKAQPPTYHRTNKITKGFQNIVDAYGHANYREINPTPFTVITFPFLFAVMFGDLGHGFLMFSAALFLVLRERDLQARRIRDEIFQTFFGGRYVILLMGGFAMYTGLIYNDLFSRSMNLFGSGWTYPKIDPESEETGSITLDPAIHFTNQVYVFGIDPVWNLAENKLAFLNSFKMKMSVILGIIHMTFGVFLSLSNYRYFNKPLDITHVFFPQLLFLVLLFVYLCLLIIFKWLYFGVTPMMTAVGPYPSSHCAPSLLIGFINMFMMKSRPSGFVKEKDYDNPECLRSDAPTGACEEIGSCNLTAFYPGQVWIESVLVVAGLCCIPWMLFCKPLLLRARHYRVSEYRLAVHVNVNGDEATILQNEKGGDSHGASEDPAKFDFGETMIYSAIHTIEFSLGCISHTASYLRLWALSLAHAQLSEVLWSMVLRKAFNVGSEQGGSVVMSLAIYLITFIFSVLTISILVLMEGLSAFLHALRLHWVEFQSKFYGGTGYPFVPFSFEEILETARVADHAEV